MTELHSKFTFSEMMIYFFNCVIFAAIKVKAATQLLQTQLVTGKREVTHNTVDGGDCELTVYLL